MDRGTVPSPDTAFGGKGTSTPNPTLQMPPLHPDPGYVTVQVRVLHHLHNKANLRSQLLDKQSSSTHQVDSSV